MVDLEDAAASISGEKLTELQRPHLNLPAVGVHILPYEVLRTTRAVEVLPLVTGRKRIPVPQEWIAEFRDRSLRAARPTDVDKEFHRQAAIRARQTILERLVTVDADLSEMTANPIGTGKNRRGVSCPD